MHVAIQLFSSVCCLVETASTDDGTSPLRIRPEGGSTGATLLKFKRAPTPELVVSGSGTPGGALA